MLRHFAKPEVADDTDLPALRTEYSAPLQLESFVIEGGRAWPPEVARQLVAAAYATTESAEVVLEPADIYDELLLSLLGQMWPELRRRFGFRTRYRRAGSTVATFAIEVVERASSREPVGKVPTGAWVDALTYDLDFTHSELRDWLRHFGPDGPADRQAVPPLASLFIAARTGDTTDVINRLLLAYPRREQMDSLKAALFGAPRVADRLALWPTAEESRLALTLRASAALDLDKLQLEDRLTILAHSDAPRMLELVRDIDWNALDEHGHDSLIAALTHGLEPRSLVEVAASRHNLTQSLLSGRPDTWQQSEVWADQFVADIVRSLLAETTDELRAATLTGLVTTGQKSPAVELCEHYPTLWWTLFKRDTAAALLTGRAAMKTAHAVGSRIDAKAVGSPSFELSTLEQLELLGRATDPDNGLWKAAGTSGWLDVAKRTRGDRWHGDSYDAFNVQVIALASAEASRDLQLREATWTTVFGDMHRQMASSEPKGAERTLDRVLPGGPKWDWCGRLREGLARLAVDGKWDPERIRSVAKGAGDFASDVARRVNERTDSHNEGFLDGLKNLFRL